MYSSCSKINPNHVTCEPEYFNYSVVKCGKPVGYVYKLLKEPTTLQTGL